MFLSNLRPFEPINTLTFQDEYWSFLMADSSSKKYPIVVLMYHKTPEKLLLSTFSYVDEKTARRYITTKMRSLISYSCHSVAEEHEFIKSMKL